MKTALIFGMSGQAGIYLAAHLKSLGEYKIVGTYHTAGFWTGRVYGEIHQVDIKNKRQVTRLIQEVTPDEVYNLAALMFAPASWDRADEYTQVIFGCLPNLLDSLLKYSPKARYFQAGSASVFDLTHVPQSIHTNMRPKDPYGVAKMAAYSLVRAYRDRGMYGCTGVIFNMESPLRQDTFFANRVCKAAAEIAAGTRALLTLGSLAAKRDWGWTEEYVRAMHLMLQQPVPEDFVLGTGECHSCLEFVQEALRVAGASKNAYTCDPGGSSTFDTLQADTSYTSQYLKWTASIKFKSVISRLVEYYSEDLKEKVGGVHGKSNIIG